MDTVPNITNILTQVQFVYHEADKTSVPIVAEWPLMDSPMLTIVLTICYVIYSGWLGPLMMKNREAFDLREPMLFYNVLLFSLNLYILHEFITGAYQAGYSFPCMPFAVSSDPAHVKIAGAVWWYFFSKIIEFMDTIFFVLRKKDRQVSFLHVYHHASMPILWWVCTKWVPGGQSVYGAGINVVVHVVMYFYYAMSALGPKYQKYLWWKRYLTQFQLVQFMYEIWLCIYSWYTECPYIYWLMIFVLFYNLVFLLLFINFYIHAYLKQNTAKAKGA